MVLVKKRDVSIYSMPWRIKLSGQEIGVVHAIKDFIRSKNKDVSITELEELKCTIEEEINKQNK